MMKEETVRGANFTCFHAGPKEGWTQYGLEPPEVPLPAKGKLFLRPSGEPGAAAPRQRTAPDRQRQSAALHGDQHRAAPVVRRL
jgi:hypothetical protein